MSRGTPPVCSYVQPPPLMLLNYLKGVGRTVRLRPILSLMTVSVHALRAAASDPVEALRYE